MIEISTLIQLLREFNTELDHGRQRDLDVAAVKDAIRTGSLVGELRSRLEYDSCVHEMNTDEVSDLNVAMIELMESDAGEGDHLSGSKRRGLCLLIALTTNLLENRLEDQTAPRIPIPAGRSRAHTGSGLRYHIAEAVRLTRRMTEGRR